MELIIQALVAGIFATAIIDIWAAMSNRVFRLPVTNWAMVGRWLGHIPAGRFVHSPVSSSPPINNELLIGWIFHYFTGLVYALVYLYLLQILLAVTPTLISGLLFGMVTIVSPWFIMQPALGIGICASKAPYPNVVRLQNFLVHSIFGASLYFGWLLAVHIF